MKAKIFGLALLLTCCQHHSQDILGDKEKITQDFGSSITGIWTDGSGPNASFSIEQDSIYDVDHNTSTMYVQNGDSVTIYYPGETLKIKMYKSHEDTLIYDYDGLKTKYWKFTE